MKITELQWNNNMSLWHRALPNNNMGFFLSVKEKFSSENNNASWKLWTLPKGDPRDHHPYNGRLLSTVWNYTQNSLILLLSYYHNQILAFITYPSLKDNKSLLMRNHPLIPNLEEPRKCESKNHWVRIEAIC